MPSNTDSTLSLRSSCNRCRFQKLKCTPAPRRSSLGEETCQRCFRAKVPCIFSRRAQTRQSDDTRKTPTQRSREKSQPPADSTQPSPQASSSDRVSPDKAYLKYAKNMGDAATDLTMLDMDLNQLECWEPAIALDNFPMGTTAGIASLEGRSPVYSYDIMREYDQDSRWQTENVSSYIGSPQLPAQDKFPWNLHQSMYPTSDNQNGDAKPLGGTQSVFSAPARAGLCHTRSNFDTVQKLSALVAEMGDNLRLLTEGTWTTSNQGQSLNDYPIGGVLHLSQEFANILSTVSLLEGFNRPNNSEFGEFTKASIDRPSHGEEQASIYPSSSSNSPKQPAQGTSSPAVPHSGNDIPVRLLVHTCYLLLTQIYSIVFGHFQECFCRLPVAAPVTELRRGAQMGDLPVTNDAYSRTSTAVRMLLERLKYVEDIMAIPLGFRCAATSISSSSSSADSGSTNPDTSTDGGLEGSPWFVVDSGLAVVVLSQDVMKGGGCGSDGLREKVRAVKRLLRERMGL